MAWHYSINFIVLFTALQARAEFGPNYEKVTDDILKVVSLNEVTILGEKHELRDARRMLMAVLHKGVEQNLIDGFTTEYVAEENEADFQSYLRDPNAGRGSAAEQAFFAKIRQHYVWPNDELNLDFYRLMRELKIAHPQLKICGLDISVSSDLTIRAERFKRFPPVLRRAAENAFLLSVEEMIAEQSSNFDREPLMALRADNCLGGAKHGLAHMGAFHATGERHQASPGWEATSYFMRALRPLTRIPTIVTALPVHRPGTQIGWLDELYLQANSILHAKDPNAVSFIDAQELSGDVQAVLTYRTGRGESFSIFKMWDYFIFGPEGEFAPIH